MSKVLMTVLVMVVIVFALQNTTPVALTFIAWRFEASLVIVLAAAVVIGASIGMLALLPTLVRRRRAIVAGKRKIAELELQHKPAATDRPARP